MLTTRARASGVSPSSASNARATERQSGRWASSSRASATTATSDTPATTAIAAGPTHPAGPGRHRAAIATPTARGTSEAMR